MIKTLKNKTHFMLLLILVAGGALTLSSCGKSKTMKIISRNAGGNTGSGEAIQAINLSNFQAASVVIGQNNFVTGSAQPVSATSLSGKTGNPFVSPSGVLFISDENRNRILGFNSVPTTNGAAADFVLGQSDFTSTSPGTDADEFDQPRFISILDNKLFTSEVNNSRVSIWNIVPGANKTPANIVVGWPSFAIPSSGCALNTFSNYEGSFIAAGGKLIVADSDNHRILIWNQIPTTNGETPDIVLGQTNFSSCTSGLDDDRLNYPVGVWTDGSKLIVADSGNNRVLVWHSFPTTNGTAADVVLGQPDMSTANWAAASSKDLSEPNVVVSNGLQLFVSDYFNNRILVWNTIPTTSYTSADVVLGQSNFTQGTSNDDNQNGVDDGVPSSRTLFYPAGLYIGNNKLIVSDSVNRRVLIFSGL